MFVGSIVPPNIGCLVPRTISICLDVRVCVGSPTTTGDKLNSQVGTNLTLQVSMCWKSYID